MLECESEENRGPKPSLRDPAGHTQSFYDRSRRSQPGLSNWGILTYQEVLESSQDRGVARLGTKRGLQLEASRTHSWKRFEWKKVARRLQGI
jgi:hypothetical protein